MRREEIINIVETATGIKLNAITRKKNRTVLFARYVAILMMREEGYSARYISKGFTPELDRSVVYKAIAATNNLINDNKEFKKMYLACIKRMADMEDAA